jgi:two-component system sensor kinase FixL
MHAQPMDGRRLVVETNRLGNDFLSVTIRDSGTGLPAELRERVFDPFVTTKSDGMGLGLAICRSILAAHGGRIWGHNNTGGGAVFGFSLPLFETRAPTDESTEIAREQGLRSNGPPADETTDVVKVTARFR